MTRETDLDSDLIRLNSVTGTYASYFDNNDLTSICQCTSTPADRFGMRREQAFVDAISHTFVSAHIVIVNGILGISEK